MTTATEKPKLTVKDFQVPFPNDWCPGCGDFGILNSVQQAFARLGLQAHQVAVVGGIGCSGKAPYYFPVYGVHTLHGRLLPFAQGIKLANPEVTQVTLLAEPQTDYEQIIAVMDGVRAVVVREDGAASLRELFPDVSLGPAPDAPPPTVQPIPASIGGGA